MKLSICVVTMNRAAQLKEALESCLACKLPDDTEFVVIDNASTDDTERVVHTLLKSCGYPYYYEKLKENIGAGAGRNYYYDKSSGEYVYGMDDDAIVDVKNNVDFFVRAIEILDVNRNFATLATQIYDVSWQAYRQTAMGKCIIPGVHKCKMFCGGSHFLRRAAFRVHPYLSNKYGYEELPPSLIAYDSGMYNVFCPDLLVIHKPVINKWDYNDEKNHGFLIKEIAVPYAIKKMMYPAIFTPILALAHKRRIKKYKSNIPNFGKRVNNAVDEFCREYPIEEKIKSRTVCKLFKEFGLSVF